MFLLMAQHFAHIKRSAFQSDLADKNWVILLSHPQTGQLLGFSTLALYETPIRGMLSSVVCSGDTIVARSARRSTSLSSAWIGAVNTLRQSLNKDTLHWLLLVSGYRTYRFLPVFWQEFYPRFSSPTPPEVQQVINALAQERFGSQYDTANGIVRFKHPQVLAQTLSGIPQHRRSNPHVDFFARANPGHADGDELVCYTELKQSNLTRAGARMWRAGEQLHSSLEPQK